MKNLMFSICSTFFVFAVVMLCTNVRAMAQPPEPLIINFVEDVDLFSFQSSNENTHLRLEYVQVPDTNQYELHISSTTSPIRYLNRVTNESYIATDPIVLDAGVARFRSTFLLIVTGNGSDTVELIGKFRQGSILADWAGVDVCTGNGADDVLIEGVFTDQMRLSTGGGSDQVALRDCRGRVSYSLFSELEIDTGDGDDQITMLGYNDFPFFAINMGRGDDVLLGDAEGQILSESWFTIQGGLGFDTLINSNYFRYASRPWAFPGFEWID